MKEILNSADAGILDPEMLRRKNKSNNSKGVCCDRNANQFLTPVLKNTEIQQAE